MVEDRGGPALAIFAGGYILNSRAIQNFMFLATINKPKQLAYFSFIGDVRVEELANGLTELPSLLADLSPGISVLTDWERLHSLEPGCEKLIGETMALCDAKEVSLVIRIVPDPTKDVGLNILALFHYRTRPRHVTCETMKEAARLLSL